MKRDMDLIRKILLEIESTKDRKIRLEIAGYEEDTINLHVELMEEKGLVDAIIKHTSDNKISLCIVRRMTWYGHDFLDAARDDTIWKNAKKICLEKTGGLMFDLLLGCLISMGKQALNIE